MKRDPSESFIARIRDTLSWRAADVEVERRKRRVTDWAFLVAVVIVLATIYYLYVY